MSDTKTFPQRDEMERLLESRNACCRLDDAVLVTTDVLLPGGSKVIAVVEGGRGGDRVTATDAGAALISVAEAGFALDALAYASLKRVARGMGLSLEGGALRSEAVPPDQAAYAVVMLANGARDVANAAFQAARKHERRRFRERVEQELGRIFGSAIVKKDARLRGASEDSLRFDYLVTVNPSQRLLIDAPVPDSSSIAAVVLRQADMKAAAIRGLHQAIVYDEADRWPSSNLAQLRLAQVPLISARFLQTGLLAAAG